MAWEKTALLVLGAIVLLAISGTHGTPQDICTECCLSHGGYCPRTCPPCPTVLRPFPRPDPSTSDPCAAVGCPPGRVCIARADGISCEPLDQVCAPVKCPPGQKCVVTAGTVGCGPGSDPRPPQPITDPQPPPNACASARCPSGQVCLLSGRGHVCISQDEACAPVACSPGYQCVVTNGGVGCSPIDVVPITPTLPVAPVAPIAPISPQHPCATTSCPSGLVCVLRSNRITCESPSDVCAPVTCPPGRKCAVRNGAVGCEAYSIDPTPPPGHVPGVCPKSTVQVCTLIASLDGGCDSDASCASGQKCCYFNCQRQCVPACSSGCPSGQSCQLQQFQGACADGLCPPAPAPIAVCQADPSAPTEAGICPINDATVACAGAQDTCSSDSACPDGHRCCQYGCGRSCVPACRRCAADEQCILRRSTLECITSPCPSQIAVCRPLSLQHFI